MNLIDRLRKEADEWEAVSDDPSDCFYSLVLLLREAADAVASANPAETLVRVELPKPRVQGFDKMFKKLGEILEPSPQGEAAKP